MESSTSLICKIRNGQDLGWASKGEAMAAALEPTAEILQAGHRMPPSSAVPSLVFWFSSSSQRFSSSAGDVNEVVVAESVRSSAWPEGKDKEEEAEGAVTWEQKKGKRTSLCCRITSSSRTERRCRWPSRREDPS